MSLFGILKNRTPIVYELVSVSGSPADTTRSVACNVEADLHTGKDYKTYEYQISMVLENGLWYVDPASIVANYTSEPTLVPELTPAPDGAAAGTAGDIIDAEIKNRLNEFILFWSANDCPSMVNYCTSDWKSKQENPQASLLAVLKNRTAVTYKLNALLKAPDNKSCTASCNIEIDSNIGKPHRIYLYMISMVLEDDGLWYVDPASLATNEIPESAPVPEQTPAPAAEITGDTILYYNPEGGSKYHLDPNCKTVNPKFLPLQGTFRYSEVNDPQYQELRTCHICLAPERPSGDSGELSPSDYTQKAWAFTPEIYTVKLDVDGQQCIAILKEAQFHPVKDNVLHVDFYQITDEKPIVMEVPIKLNGLAEGVKAGGKLSASVRKLKVKAVHTAIPERLDIDVTHLQLGKTIKVGELNFEGLELVTSPSVVVCQVKMTRNARSAASTEEAEA